MKDFKWFTSIILLFTFLHEILNAQSDPQWYCQSNSSYIIDMKFNSGIVWIASSGGLVKLDTNTRHKQIFTTANSILNTNFIKEIEFDQWNNLWINEYGGAIIKFDGTNWETFYSLNGIDTTSGVIHMERNKNGDMVFLEGLNKNQRTLYLYSNSSFQTINNPFSILRDFVTDTVGNIVALVDTGRVAVYNGSSWSYADTIQQGLQSKGIVKIAIDKNNKLWGVQNINGIHNLCYYDSTGWNIMSSLVSNIPAASSFNMNTTKERNLVFYNGLINGIVIYDGNGFTKYNYVNLNTTDFFTYATSDGFGNLYYGTNPTEPNNFYIHDNLGITTYNISNSSIAGYHHTDVEIGKNGDIWVSNVFGGIAKLDGFSCTNYDTINSGLASNNNQDLFIDSKDNLWIASSDNDANTLPLTKWDGLTWTTYDFSYFGLKPGISKCAEDDSGNIWVNVDGFGVSKFDGVTWTNWNAADLGITNFNPLDLTIDSSNNVWVGTLGQGIAKYSNGTWVLYNSTNSNLPNDNIWLLYCDLDNKLWFLSSTEWGYFDTSVSNFVVFPFPNVNSPPGIHSFYMDMNHIMWISSSSGLYKKNGVIWNFYTNYNSDISMHGAAKMCSNKYGNLYMATAFGLYQFNENGITPQSYYNIPIAQFGGRIYFDADSNKSFNVNLDYPMTNKKVICISDSSRTYSNALGVYKFIRNSGPYSSVYLPDSMWTLTTDSNSFSVLVDTTNIFNLDYGCYPKVLYDNLSVDIVATSNRCSSLNSIWVTCTNLGSTFIDAIIELSLDDSLTFISSIPFVDSTAGVKIYWHLDSLPPFQQKSFLAKTMNPGVNSINDTLISFVKVFDGQGVFDSSFIAQVITCSYDPNNKEGQPLGQSSFHYIPLGDSIEYTIHFQNLGNDTALNIFIIDTLDEKFNHDSFEFLSSSHDCHIDIDKDGRATFSFYNIMLPCSLHNEFESVGFIKYRLYPKNTVSHGDVVVNKANIFFDFNPAIETNTTIHTYLNPSLYISSITYNADFIIYPNPFSDYITCNIPMKPLESSTVVIFDTRGKVLLRANNVKSGEQISLKEINAGIYIMQVCTPSINYQAKIVKTH